MLMVYFLNVKVMTYFWTASQMARGLGGGVIGEKFEGIIFNIKQSSDRLL